MVMELINWCQKIWKYNRWELFLVISLIVFIFCYFFSDQEEYRGLGYDYVVPAPKKKIKKKTETKCRDIVERIFNKRFPSIRPNFLKNPKTGKNLELDMYNEEIQLAIEYQGMQHRVYSPYFHKCEQDFYDQVERDNFKKIRCREVGIDLICIPDTVRYEELEDYILSELKKINRI